MKLSLSFLLLSTSFLCTLPALSPKPAGAEDLPETVTLTLLHTNDIHGRIFPFSYPATAETNSDVGRMPVTRDIGGLARIAGLVDSIRNEPGHETLLFDAGDIVGETPLSLRYKGRAVIEGFNAIGYDAITIGEWDIKKSPEEFFDLVDAADFPVLCANALSIEDEQPVLPASMLLQVGPIRVGILGLTGHFGRPDQAFKDRAEIEIPRFAAPSVVEGLHADGADLVIAVTHLGISGDVNLATLVPGIDVILGGHSHDRLDEPHIVSGIDPITSRHRETIIAHTYRYGGELGRLDLTLTRGADGGYDLVGYQHELIPITADIPEDPRVAGLIDSLYQPFAADLDEPLGTATADLENVGFERATVHLVTDAMREATGAQVALLSYSDARASIFEGTIRMYDLAMMLPYDDSIILMETTGARLQRALADGRDFLGFSGLEVIWADRRPDRIDLAGTPLDIDGLYTIAIPAHTYERILSDVEEAWESGKRVRPAVAAYIRTRGEIGPVLDGRTRRIGK